jgi:4-amino-4-deoxy-L-arabinose transferase-like glycosyltransferase
MILLKSAAEKYLLHPIALPILFALYILPRVLVILVPVTPTSDAAWYLNRATALALGQGYSESGVLTAYWPPGWPLTVAILFRWFGISLVTVKLFNLACSLLVGWLTWKLGGRLFNSELVGRLSLLLLAVYPNSIGYLPLAWTEVFYTCLLLSGTYAIIMCRSLRGLIATGLIFGLATLVKTQSLLVVPFIFLSKILATKIDPKQLFAVGLKCTTILVVAFATILPWSYRNYRVFGEWVFVSTNGGLTLLTGNNPSARGDYTPDDPLVTSLQRTVVNQVSIDKEAKQRSIRWIMENPKRFLQLLPLKAYRLWAPDGESEWWYQLGFESYTQYAHVFRGIRYINQLFYVSLMIAFIVVGSLLVIGRFDPLWRSFEWCLLPYTVAAYQTLVALAFSGQSRFHYPVMPFIIMACGWLIVKKLLTDTRH